MKIDPPNIWFDDQKKVASPQKKNHGQEKEIYPSEGSALCLQEWS